MYAKVIAGAAVALFALLGYLAVVVTEFHDRAYPQGLGVAAKVTLDFSESEWGVDGALGELRRVDQEYGLGLVKVAPDLDDVQARVFVDLTQEGGSRPLGWFSGDRPARVVGVERLANSSPDGTYFVRDDAGLSSAVGELAGHGVGVQLSGVSAADTIRGLAGESGFVAPLVAACVLIGAMTVFWLSVKARSRALRVLAGAAPWRIQAQDLGVLAGVLAGCAAGVVGLAAVLVGVLRGWVFVPSYVTFAGFFAGVTLASSIVVALVLSVVAWPSADLFVSRLPAVKSLRWAAWAVQGLVLVTLLAYTGPAWSAARDAGQTARQLAVWSSLSDQVLLAFGLESDSDLDAVEGQVRRVVDGAEDEGQAALSYAISAEHHNGDFEGYSAISLVNREWIDLVGGHDVLEPVPAASVAGLLDRELRPALEVWNHAGDATATLEMLTAYTPRPATWFTVADAGSPGDLRFPGDVLVLEVPRIAAVFDDSNLTSLATTGNIVLTGVDATQARLKAEGLDAAGLAERGIDGTIRPVYAAEEGILVAQFSTHRARLLAVSMAAIAIAFVVAAAVNAMVGALLGARRDFPRRLSGATWATVARHRALRDVVVGAVITAILAAISPGEARWVVLLAALAGLTLMCASHLLATSLVFRQVIDRRL